MQYKIPLSVKTAESHGGMMLDVAQLLAGLSQQRLHACKRRPVLPLGHRQRLASLNCFRHECGAIAIL